MSASQQQIIRVIYDATQAQRDAAKWAADEQRRTKQTAAEAAKAAKETAAAQTKAAKEAAAEAKKAAAEQAKAAKEAAATQASTAREVNALLKQLSREEAAEAKKAIRDKRQAESDAFKQWKQDHMDRHKVAMMAWKEQQDATKKQTSLLDGAGAALGGFVAGMLTLQTLVSVVQSLSEYFAKIRAETLEAAKEVAHYREEVLELAAMKDQLGNSTPEVVAQLQFRSQTGQSRQAALAMSTAAEVAGQAAIGKNLTREAFEAGREAAGQLQAMERSDPAAYGRLLGTLALEAPKGTTPEQMKGLVNREYEIQKPGSFGNMAQYAGQREQLTSYVQTGAVTGGQASALLSALSLENSPDQAATMAQQILRSTSADFMRARGMKVLEGTEHETARSIFRSISGSRRTPPPGRPGRRPPSTSSSKSKRPNNAARTSPRRNTSPNTVLPTPRPGAVTRRSPA